MASLTSDGLLKTDWDASWFAKPARQTSSAADKLYGTRASTAPARPRLKLDRAVPVIQNSNQSSAGMVLLAKEHPHRVSIHDLALRSQPARRVKPTCTAQQFQYVPLSEKRAISAHVAIHRLGHMPGYTGHTPGVQLVAARSYGRTTQRAMKHNATARDLYQRDLIPASPQLKDKLRPPMTMSHSIGALPGYTGYIMGSRQRFGQRFAETSVMAGHTGYSLTSSASRKALNRAKVPRKKAGAAWV